MWQVSKEGDPLTLVTTNSAALGFARADVDIGELCCWNCCWTLFVNPPQFVASTADGCMLLRRSAAAPGLASAASADLPATRAILMCLRVASLLRGLRVADSELLTSSTVSFALLLYFTRLWHVTSTFTLHL